MLGIRQVSHYLLLGEVREDFWKATKLQPYPSKLEECREATHSHEKKILRECGIKSYSNQQLNLRLRQGRIQLLIGL